MHPLARHARSQVLVACGSRMHFCVLHTLSPHGVAPVRNRAHSLAARSRGAKVAALRESAPASKSRQRISPCQRAPRAKLASLAGQCLGRCPLSARRASALRLPPAQPTEPLPPRLAAVTGMREPGLHSPPRAPGLPKPGRGLSQVAKGARHGGAYLNPTAHLARAPRGPQDRLAGGRCMRAAKGC